MKISKTSWHYKLLSFFNDKEYLYNLNRGALSNCQYIRHVMYSVLGTILFSAVALFGVFLIIQTVILLPLWLIFSPTWLTPGLYLGEGWISTAIGVFILACLFAIFACFVHISKQYKRKKELKAYERMRKGIVKKVKPDNIVKAYLKAKNDKICTRVEVIEE